MTHNTLASSPPTVRVEIRSADAPPRYLALSRTTQVIGRSPACAIHLDHDTVSRTHAELFVDPFGRWWIRDLKSRNGIRVNGQRVQELGVGVSDAIRVGKFELRLRDAADVNEPSAPLIEEASAGAADMDLLTIQSDDCPMVAASILSSLLDLSQKLCLADDASERRRLLSALLVTREFHGIASLVIRVPRGEGEIRVLCGPCVAIGPQRPFHVSRSLLRQMAATGKAMIGTNAGRMNGTAEISVDASVCRAAAIACPVNEDAEGIVAIYVAMPPELATSEWLAAVSLAARHFQEAQDQWQARREHARHEIVDYDLQQARQIQRKLLPPAGSCTGLEWALYYEPSRWVGGDYVDAARMDDDHAFLAIADVCGKGLQASLVSASLHTLVRTGLKGGMPLPLLMQSANDYMAEYLPTGSFVTMIGMLACASTGTVEFCNAGHPPAVVVSPDGSIREIRDLGSGFNFPLGIGHDVLSSASFDLLPDEILVIYTDGLTDVQNEDGDLLGEEPLLKLLRNSLLKHSGRPLSDAVRCIGDAIDAYRGAKLPMDDRTLLLCRRTRLP